MPLKDPVLYVVLRNGYTFIPCKYYIFIVGAVIAADSAYRGWYPFMVTPFLSVAGNEAKARFNQSHKKARVSVERCIGILKRRFPSLQSGLRLPSMQKCSRVIQLICAIHNFITREENDEDLVDHLEPVVLAPRVPPVPNADPLPRNRVQTRDIILEQYFQ